MAEKYSVYQQALPAKTTAPVSGDSIWIWDSTDSEAKKIDATLIGGGSGTTTNVNGAIAALPGIVSHFPLSDAAGTTAPVDALGAHTAAAGAGAVFGVGGTARDGLTALHCQDSSTNPYVTFAAGCVPTSGSWYVGFIFEPINGDSQFLFTTDPAYGSGSVQLGWNGTSLTYGFATSTPSALAGTGYPGRGMIFYVVSFSADAYSHNYVYQNGVLMLVDSFSANGYGATPRIGYGVSYAAKFSHVFFGAGAILSPANVNSVWEQI